MSVLSKQLVFGDQEQIDALRSLLLEAERRERLNTYEVTVRVDGYATITVEEENEDEAAEHALEIVGDTAFNANFIDVDCSLEGIEKIEEKVENDECQNTLW